MTITSDLKRYYASSGSAVKLDNLEIKHTTFSNLYYIVNDFQDLTAGLEIVKDIKPRIFDWKDGDKGNNIFGFIAQELEEVMPTAVINGDVKSINVTSIVSVLVKSVQELTKKSRNFRK
jgi:hypothetical protein